MAADFHAVGFCEGDDLVALGEGEGGRVGTDDPPLHRVLGFQHVELAAEGGGVGRLGELRGAHGGADKDSGAVGSARRDWAGASEGRARIRV